MKTRILFVLILLFAIGYTLYSNLSTTEISTEHRPEVGFKAPDFKLKNLHTEELVSLGEATKPVVINFWASWCTPCKAEAPDLVEVYEEYKDEIDLYAINMTYIDSLRGTKMFIEEFDIEFPVLLDEGVDTKQVSERYNILSIPTTFFVNAEGTIVHKIAGIATKQQLEKQFRKLARN
jgi:cytochrome c biogenesis protein CcmG/thiol:disulfide interchange protein DsbE